jgi:hypothetical protein
MRWRADWSACPDGSALPASAVKTRKMYLKNNLVEVAMLLFDPARTGIFQRTVLSISLEMRDCRQRPHN